MEKWAIHFAIAFALRQIAKFHDTVDWTKVKAGLDVRIAGALPGSWLDSEATREANWVIDAFAKGLTKKDELQKLIDLTVAGDWAGALAAAKALLQAATYSDAIAAA